jgi:antitoxin VapB
MPLNIKDRITELLVRELAALTGETVMAAVRRAAEERLQRVRRDRGGRSLAVEILGYDEHGLPR